MHFALSTYISRAPGLPVEFFGRFLPVMGPHFTQSSDPGVLALPVSFRKINNGIGPAIEGHRLWWWCSTFSVYQRNYMKKTNSHPHVQRRLAPCSLHSWAFWHFPFKQNRVSSKIRNHIWCALGSTSTPKIALDASVSKERRCPTRSPATWSLAQGRVLIDRHKHDSRIKSRIFKRVNVSYDLIPDCTPGSK